MLFNVQNVALITPIKSDPTVPAVVEQTGATPPQLPKVERDQLVLSHLGLARSIANRLARGNCVLVDDLAQEGHIGLIEAASRFDPARGYQFSTYATFWVRERILQYLLKLGRGGVANGSSNAARKVFFQLGVACRKLGVLNATEADASEIAAVLGIPTEKFQELLPGILPAVNYDDCLDHADDASGGATPETALIEQRDRITRETFLTAALSLLTPKEAEVIKRRFLNDPADTLEAISSDKRLFGRRVSRERVRQIQEAALEKLRQLADVVDIA